MYTWTHVCSAARSSVAGSATWCHPDTELSAVCGCFHAYTCTHTHTGHLLSSTHTPAYLHVLWWTPLEPCCLQFCVDYSDVILLPQETDLGWPPFWICAKTVFKYRDECAHMCGCMYILWFIWTQENTIEPTCCDISRADAPDRHTEAFQQGFPSQQYMVL